MKLEFEYLRFDRDGDIYVCRNSTSGHEVGEVIWHKSWEAWVFTTTGKVLWDCDILNDINEFLKQLNK